MITKILLSFFAFTLFPLIKPNIANVTSLADTSQFEIDSNSLTHSEINFYKLSSENGSTSFQILEIPEERDKVIKINNSPLINKTTKVIHSAPIRLMPIGVHANIDAAAIDYERQVQLGEDNPVTVRTSPATPGAKIYMRVTDTCKKNDEHECVRLTSSELNYEPDYLLNPIIDQLLTDNDDGTYTGTYKITHTKAGFVTISLYVMIQGLLRACYSNSAFTPPAFETSIESQIQYEWNLGNVCTGLADDVTLRWRGKLIITESKYYHLELIADTKGKLFIDGSLTIDSLYNSPPDDIRQKVFISTGEHDLLITLSENSGAARLKFNWRDSDTSSYEPVPSSAFGCAGSMFASLNVEVTCKAGYYINTITGICVQCPEGTYNNETGQKFCKPCPEGSYGDEIGLTVESKCKSCPKGTYSSAKGLTGSSQCESCPEGTYNDITGLTHSSQCKECSEGTYSNAKGLTDSSQCKSCPEGTYNDIKGRTYESQCKKCPEGTYNDITRLTSSSLCKFCPEGTYSNAKGLTNSSQCKSCPEGTYNDIKGRTDESQCKSCPEGTYNDITRLTSISLCKECPEGTYNDITKLTASSQCKDCPEGTYNDITRLTSISLCKPCPEGTYNDITRLTLSSQCKFCPEGTYNDIKGLTALSQCKLCPEGTYNDVTRLTSSSQCKECPEGTYNDIRGLIKLSQCKDCPKGTYNDIKGLIKLSQCKLCPEGTYNSLTRQISNNICLKCSLMTYGDRPGLSRCKDCPMKTYSDEWGAISCSPCHPSCSICYGPSETQCYSCVVSSGSIFDGSNTCQCTEHQYYDSSNNRCVDCHGLCSTCFGPSFDECITCNPSISYRVEGKPNTCVLDCEDGYYRSSLICKPCSSPCKTCTGDKGKLCLTCLSPDKVIDKYLCINKCPDHHLNVTGVCNKCWNCQTLARTGCVSCTKGKILLDGQCISQCPSGYYLDSNTCQPCTSPCSTCTSAHNCITCLPSFYKNGEICVGNTQCEAGTYPDSDKMRCEPCSRACLTCYGPTSLECLKCNYLKGFERKSSKSSECLLINCVIGTYLEIDADHEAFKCLPCNESCLSCSSPDKCLECKEGYMNLNKSAQNGSLCSGCPIGYTTSPKGGCEEVCGDGMSLGMLECDDGNNNDGDGCSHNCKVEENYKCYRQIEGPDECRDVIPPRATIKVIRGNKIIIRFNEMVFSNYSSIIVI